MNEYTRRDFLKMGGILGASLAGFALARNLARVQVTSRN